MKLKSLKQDARNANKGTERGAKVIEQSLRDYGAGRSILLDKSGNIIAGNKTAQAAGVVGLEDVQIVKSDGKRLIAVQRTDLDINDATARQLAIADNRASELSLNWDLDELNAFDKELDLSPFWTKGEMDALMDPIRGGGEAPEPKIDEGAELLKKWGCKLGDVWLIGAHWLLCGDSTDKAAVGALMANKPALPGLMVTDPPYGVDYDPEWRTKAGINKTWQTVATGTVSNDDQVDWTAAWALSPAAVAYVWHAGRYASAVQASLEAAEYETRSQIIWAKNSLVISRGHYHWQHEPCWYAVKRGKKASWCGDHKQSTIWNIPNMHRTQGDVDDGKTVHGTQKPVECMARPMRNHEAPVVYDPFLGSGTTMVAAEQLKRVCFGVELDPTYVAIALERMSEMGLHPKLTNG